MAGEVNRFENSVALRPLTYKTPTTLKRNVSSSLDLESFLQLMAAQLQNQDPLNPTSNEDYMMQLAQMTVVEAMTNMTQVSLSTYAASMVGKEVTLAEYDKNGNMKQVTGTVTGVTIYNNDPVIYVGDKAYSLDQLIAVGTLPKDTEDSGNTGDNGNTDTDKE